MRRKQKRNGTARPAVRMQLRPPVARWVAMLLCVLTCGLLAVGGGRADPPPVVKQEVGVFTQPSYGFGYDPTRALSAADGRKLVQYMASMDGTLKELLQVNRAMGVKSGAVAAVAAPEAAGDAILVRHCGSCHGDGEKKGKFQMVAGGRLVMLKDDEWDVVWKLIDADEMPKPPSPPLTPAEKAAAKRFIDQVIAPRGKQP